MKTVAVRSCKKVFPVLMAVIFAGCDQINELTSGGGSKGSIPTQAATGTISDQSGGDATSDAVGESSSVSGSGTAETGGDSQQQTWDEVLTEMGVEPDPEPEVDDSSDGRNVEQYLRLPGNVTWKPISASSGGNLTIVLWGDGGGEKDYEEGSLRVEHNDGVEYPREYVPWDDPDNAERAPKFYFDVQGGWFTGKDPVLFWNLGAYRIIEPEKRQGKNEE